MNRSVLAIDIGSNKICAIIADIDEDGEIQVSGSGISKSQGLKRGIITNIDLAAKSIKSAINDAKRVAGTDINKAIVSFSGAYTKSINSSGIVNIPNKEIAITEIDRVMESALYNASIANDYEVIHSLPYNFKVDGQDFIDDPLGMNASRLEVETHIVTTQKSNLNNLKKAVRASGVEVQNVVLSAYASAIAVLNSDEKELGVGIIDMGASSSNIAIHVGNSIRYNDFLGVGSHHITNDLSMALHTPLYAAEKVKIDYGSLYAPEDALIELPVIGDETNTHEVSLEVVHNVIYARVEETLMIIAQSVQKSGLSEQMGAGVVLTGGFTKLEGIRELAIAVFDNMPVRLAKPTEMDGLFDTLRDPSFSCAIGLIKYASGQFSSYEIDSNKRMRYLGEVITELPQQNLTNLKHEAPHERVTTEPKMNDIDARQSLQESDSEISNKKKEPNFVTKSWNMLTQLF